MKTLISTLAAIALGLISISASAQLDEREPGIYGIVNNQSTMLTYTHCGMHLARGSVNGIGVGNEILPFKGETSGVNANDTLILVINPQNRIATGGHKKYDPFIRNLTPIDILIIPLTVNTKKQCREYELGVKVGTVAMGEEAARVQFDWTRISDNSFEITIPGILPGEYGVVFRYSKLAGFAYHGIYGFTIPETHKAN